MAAPQPPQISQYPNRAAYDQAYDNYVLQVAQYNVDQFGESALPRLAAAYERLANSPNTPPALRQQYADAASTYRAQGENYYASEAAAAAQRAAEREAANMAQERALAIRDAEFARLSGLKDQQYAGIEDAYNKNVEQIRQASASGTITSGQKDTLLDQARASRDAARAEASSSYDAARGIARTNYEQRAVTPTGVEQLAGAYRPITIDTSVVAKPEESVADMTARLQREAQQAFADTEARAAEIPKTIEAMQSSLIPATDEVANKVATDLFKSSGIDPAIRPGEFANWVNEVKVFGPEAATESWNKNVVPRIEDYKQQLSQEQFAKTGIYSAPEFAPRGIAALPGVQPGAQPGTQPGFQPQRPAPTPLITQAERPTLDQTIQFIESGGMYPGQMSHAGILTRPYEPFVPQTEPYFARPEVASGIDQMTADQLTATQAFPVTAGTYYGMAAPVPGMKQGGNVAQEAKGLASLGRGGDSYLVHMSPEEVSGLRALALQQGTDLTINPETGMPEAFKLKKLFRALSPLLAFAPIPGIQGLGLLAKSALAGVIGGVAAPGGKFNFREGLKTGLMAFAGGKLAEGLQAAGQAGGTGVSSTTTAGSGGQGFKVGTSAGGVDIPSALPGATPTPVDYSLASGASGAPSLQASATPTIPTNVGTPSPYSLTPTAAPVDYSLAAPPPSTAMQATTPPPSTFSGKFEQAVGVSPTTALMGTTVGYGLLEGDAERRKFKEAEMAALQAQRDREDEYRRLFERTLGAIPMAAGGGLIALAKGGMPTFEYGGTTGPTNEPRMVKGAGDGMSDNVPATIEGVQEARLANDEFVIPADVVADIGNGSSSAGARKLYEMMDRIREARHGTTEQPPEINAEKYMPS